MARLSIFLVCHIESLLFGGWGCKVGCLCWWWRVCTALHLPWNNTGLSTVGILSAWIVTSCWNYDAAYCRRVQLLYIQVFSFFSGCYLVKRWMPISAGAQIVQLLENNLCAVAFHCQSSSVRWFWSIKWLNMLTINFIFVHTTYKHVLKLKVFFFSVGTWNNF